MADQLLVQYLLGLLSEEEAERLDEQSIADDDVAERLRVVEHDLIDAYVGGTLDASTRAQFERVYLASPRRREKVRFAESLRQVVSRPNRAIDGVERINAHDRLKRVDGVATPAATDAAIAAAARTDARPDARTGAGLLWGLAAAAVLLLVIGGALFMQTTRLRQELTAAQTERVALENRARELERQLVDQRSASDDAAKELARIRALLADGPSRPGGSSGTGVGASGSSAVLATALILTPQTRGAGPVPAIAIRAGATSVPFDLLLESNDFARYHVALRDPATNSVIWRSDRLAPSSTRQGSLISIVLPAHLLKAQHYTLELSGIRGSSDPETVSSYTFRAVVLR
jgi:hypothetical protein